MSGLTTQMGAIQRLEVPHTRAHLPRHFEILVSASFDEDSILIRYKSGASSVRGMRFVTLEVDEHNQWSITQDDALYNGVSTPQETGLRPLKVGRRNGAVAFHLVEGDGPATDTYDRKTYLVKRG